MAAREQRSRPTDFLRAGLSRRAWLEKTVCVPELPTAAVAVAQRKHCCCQRGRSGLPKLPDPAFLNPPASVSAPCAWPGCTHHSLLAQVPAVRAAHLVAVCGHVLSPRFSLWPSPALGIRPGDLGSPLLRMCLWAASLVPCKWQRARSVLGGGEKAAAPAAPGAGAPRPESRQQPAAVVLAA